MASYSLGRVLAPALLLTLVATATISAHAWRLTGGQNLYPLDDTYIHLAMAKQLLHGNWGVSGGEFSNASSAPLYILLMAATGAQTWSPLAVNLLSALGFLWLAAWLLRGQGVERLPAALWLLALALLAPLPYILQFGMEHTLHCLLLLAFLAAAIEALCTRRGLYLALALAPALVTIRLESMLAVALFTLALMAQRRWKSAVALLGSAALPLLILGLISRAHGESWLPNPILLKASPPAESLWQIPFVYSAKAAIQLLSAYPLVPLLIVLLLLADRHLKQFRTWWTPPVLWPFSVLLLLAGHVTFANVGWLGRYEIYLISTGLVAVALAAPKPPHWMAFTLAAVLGVRAVEHYRLLPVAIEEIAGQHLAMASFVQQHYNHESIALNDIGAVAYFTDAKILDLTGLAHHRVLRERLADRFNTQSVDDLSRRRRVRLAIVYDRWFAGSPSVKAFWLGPKLPSTWRKAGEWRFPQRRVIGESILSFYAVDPLEQRRLAAALEAFPGSPNRRETWAKLLK